MYGKKAAVVNGEVKKRGLFVAQVLAFLLQPIK